MSNPPTQYVEEILKNSQAQDKNYHSIIEYFCWKFYEFGYGIIQ